jgi:hypothetical protein
VLLRYSTVPWTNVFKNISLLQVEPVNTPGSSNDSADNDSSSTKNTATYSRDDSVTPHTHYENSSHGRSV